jgi:hypothetical protein
MLLSGWLFEDAAAVNDFLGEASSLQSLVQVILKPGEQQVVSKGLCALLLGIIYEYSTKDSPVPRRELQPILTSHLGREEYVKAITDLRQHALVREFSPGVPDVFFDETFVDFLEDNSRALSRAIDKDPGIEKHQSHNGIDRDLMDSLRGQLDEKNKALDKLQADILSSEQRLNQEHAEHRRTQESSLTQLNTIKRINEDLHRNHDADVKRLEREHKQASLELENRLNLQIAALNNKVQRAQKETPIAVAKATQEYDGRLRESLSARTELERRLSASDRSRQEALETVRELEVTQKQTKEEIATVTQSLGMLTRSRAGVQDASRMGATGPV